MGDGVFCNVSVCVLVQAVMGDGVFCNVSCVRIGAGSDGRWCIL